MTGLVPGLEYELVVRAPGLVLDQHSPGQVEFGRDVVLKPGEDRDLGEVRMEWWDKRAVPGLIVRLKSTEWATRGSAAGALGDLGSDAVDAVPALIEALNRDPHNTVRFGAAAALGKVGPAAKAAVPDLIKALREDTGGGVQREAAAALGLIGDPGALPFLKEALDNTDIDVRKAAGEAIERLEGSAKTRRPPR
jgi:HEAT repeat protein